MFKFKTFVFIPIFLVVGIGAMKFFNKNKPKKYTDNFYKDKKKDVYSDSYLKKYIEVQYLDSLNREGNYEYRSLFDLHVIDQDELKSKILNINLSQDLKDKYVKSIKNSKMPVFIKLS